MISKPDLEKLGVAQAVLLAAMSGIVCLAFIHLAAEISTPFKNLIFSLGKAWIPGAQAIGSFSGEETVLLIVWLSSWFFFHGILKEREWNHSLVFALFLFGIALATTLLWPPVTHWVVQIIQGFK